MRIRSRTDAAEFVRRVREFTPGGVMKMRTPSGAVLVVAVGAGGWYRYICREVTPALAYRYDPAQRVHDPARWVYANRRMVNKWLRHVEAGKPPDAVAE